MSDGEHSPSSPDSRGIGPALEDARTQKGLSFEEVEQATKIRKRYLEALEREDYSILPDAVYVQGFLKTYANYLGLDGDVISLEFKSRRRSRRVRQSNDSGPHGSEFEQPLIDVGGVSGTRGRRISGGTVLTIVGAVLVLALVIGVLYYIGKGSQAYSETNSPDAVQGSRSDGRDQASGNGSPEQATGENDDPAKNSPGRTGETTIKAPSAETLRAEVSVDKRPSWLEVRADGTTSFAEVARPGFSMTFEAKHELSLTTGDAGAVEVSVNGQEVGVLGESGQVLTRDWTLKMGG